MKNATPEGVALTGGKEGLEPSTIKSPLDIRNVTRYSYFNDKNLQT